MPHALPTFMAHDVSDRMEITATGADRVRILHGLCTNDVKSLQPHHGCEAFVTTVQGKVHGHVLIHAFAERIVLDATAVQSERLLKHFNKYVVTEDVTYTETSGERALWLLAGKESAAKLQQAGVTVPVDYLATSDIACGGAAAQLTHVAILGPDSFLLRTSQQDAEAVKAWLEASGAQIVERRKDLEGLRISAAWPEFGVDFSDENLPQEVNRTAIAISFRKGCYLGQETIARLENLGHVNKLLVRLKFAGDTLPAAGLELTHDGKVVGKVSSAGFDPQTSHPLAFAIIRANGAKAGTSLSSSLGLSEVM